MPVSAMAPSVRPPRIGRLAIQFGLAFAAAMMLVGLIGFSMADAWVANRIDSSLKFHTAKYLTPGQGQPVDTLTIRARIEDWQRRKVLSERTYLLFDPEGRRLAGRLEISPPPPGLSDLRFYGGGRSMQTGRAIATRLPDGSLFVIVQHSEAASSLHALLPAVVLAISLVALLMGVVATILFERATAQRLNETLRAADAIAAGDLSRRIATERLDGMFKRQAIDLNRMLDRMQELVDAQRLFSSNLAHELRTPLTRLRALLRQGASAVGGEPHMVYERAERECESIISIFDAMLRLAEIESGRHPTAVMPLAMDALIEDVGETMEPVIADHGGQLLIQATCLVRVAGDKNLLTQLLVNLLENVARHTPPGTCATLSLHHVDEAAEIILSDDGPGLPDDERARVTRAFARGGAAMDKRGSGLGLAIAQAIVRFHGGKLELIDAAPGLRIRVRLPALSGEITPAERADSVPA